MGGVSGSSSNGDICDKITVVLAWTGDPIAGNAERKKIKKKDGRRKRPPNLKSVSKNYIYYIISDTTKQ